MRAASFVTFTLLASAIVACSVTPRDTESVGESSQALLPRGVSPREPIEKDPPPPSHSCPSQRVDLYRNEGKCELPPASLQGKWSFEHLFPNAPPAIRERLCAYTWQPKDTTGTCAAPPWTTIPRNVTPPNEERVGLRGHCPLGSTGCQPTIWVAYGTAPAHAETTAATTASAMSKTSSSSSSGGTGSTSFVVPSTGVGCCDTCAEIQDHFAYVVLPENTQFSRVELSVPWMTETDTVAGYESIVIDQPDTNVIQVNLNPSRRYRFGRVDGVHPFE